MRLPTRDDMRRVTPGPTTTPRRIGEDASIAGFQRGAKALLEGVSTLVEEQGKKDAFEVQRRLLDFKLQQEETLENMRREMPSGGAGFSESYGKQFRKSAKAFVGKDDANIPEHLREKVGLKLKEIETGYLDRASTYERGERDRHTVESLENTLGASRASVAVNPAAHSERLKEGHELIEGSSLPPEQRRALRLKYGAEVDRAAIEAELSQAKTTADFERIRQRVAGGGVKIHTARVPTASERKRIRANGGLVINLDSNWAKVGDQNPKGRTSPMVVLPDDATEEEREAAEAYVAKIAEVMKERFGVDLKTRVVTRSQNVVDGKARGRLHTAHIEPFAVTDAEAVKFFNSDEGRKLHAGILRETLGTIPGAEFSLPHDPGRDPGAVGNGTSEVDLARGLAGHLMGDGTVGPYKYLSPADRRRYATAVAEAHKKIQGVLSKEVSRLESNAAHGYTLPQEELSALKTRIEEIGDPSLKSRLMASLSLSEAVSKNAQNPVAMNEQIVASIRERFAKEQPTPEQRERLETMERAIETQKSELRNNAIGWAVRSGVIPRTALNMQDEASMDARLEAVETTAEKFRVGRQYFAENERAALIDSFKSGKASVVQFAAALTQHWGAKHAAAAMGELKASPADAHVGGMVAKYGQSQLAKDYDAARKMKMQEGYKPVGGATAANINPAMNEVVGDAFAAVPGAADIIRNVVNPVYEYRARRDGWDDFKDDEYQKIVKEALGETKDGSRVFGGIADRDWNGPGWFDAKSYKVIVPTGVSQDEFDALVGMVKVADLKDPPKIGNRKITDEEFQNAKLLSLGDGRYMLQPDPNLPAVYEGVFDFSEVRDKLKKRRPDLFAK